MTEQMIDMIILGALSSCVLPFVFVWLKDVFANVMIACMNWHRGKPTFRAGTKFSALLLGSGKTFLNPVIESVDFSTVYIRTDEGLLGVKKNDLRTGNGFILLR